MGYGGYSYEAHQAITSTRSNLGAAQLFTQSGVHEKMNPRGVKLRECRDSAEHPDSLGICFALDISGSMGTIPVQLAKHELPRFMKILLDCGIAHPQILFMAFEDAGCCGAPLQVGQFESTAELMDKWLTLTSFQAGGGRAYTGPMRGGESYELALWFAARHTAVDAFEKRKHKGYLFMTGDEPSYDALARETVKNVLGYDLQADMPIADVMKELRKAWNPVFLIPDHQRRSVEPYWRGVFGDDVICLASPDDTCAASALIVALSEGAVPDLQAGGKALAAGGMDKARVAATLEALAPWQKKHAAAKKK